MITTNEGLLEAWANQLETMEQNLESFFGAPSITPTLPVVTTREGMLEAIATELESVDTNMKSNCPAVAKGTSVIIATKNAPKSVKSVTIKGVATGLNGMFLVDGNVTISGVSVRTNTVRCYVSVLDYEKTTESRNAAISSYLPTQEVYSNDIPGVLLAAGANYRAYISFPVEWLSETTAAGIKAYLTDHPLTIWYVTNTYDATADQYYTMSVTESDDTFHGIATSNAIAPLAAGDSIDFVRGIITRGDVASSISLTESCDNLYGNLTIACLNPLTVKYVKDLS